MKSLQALFITTLISAFLILLLSALPPNAYSGFLDHDILPTSKKMNEPTSPSKTPNRLAKEKSPYLLQHAMNPVDWYPWGAEAFQKAKTEDKLIFLSIGYSTCHWCHVMERESFENEEIARLLNEFFVAVKVDREERPDIDHIYMSAVQAMTGSGGWPLTVFLTPEGKPFTGGTYFPPEDRWGRGGMKSILPRVAQMWKEKRQEVLRAGEDLTRLLQPKTETASASLSLKNIFEQAYVQFESSFDSEKGGFGGAPKFPRSHELSFLLRYGKRSGSRHALEMVEVTLDHMARGGMYDQLGGGFHRYSTDADWLVPHFEKMLYDQAILAKTYLEAYQETGKDFYAEVARDIFSYVLRDLKDADGAFYSAEDADSEGEEGKFYVWRPEEIIRVLGVETGKLFNEFYGVQEGGNFEGATSILHIEEPLEFFARKKNLKEKEFKEFKEVLAKARQKFLEIRSKRIRPHLDDKILMSWNGLMISALAVGSQALGDPIYSQAASRAADFLLKRMVRNGRLLHRYRAGEAAILAFHEDYACLALGLLDLYEATFEVRWLEEAKRLTDDMIRLFWDKNEGGFFSTAQDAERLIARPKEYYDGAVPSGNSIAALVLLRLSRMTGDSASYEKLAEAVAKSNAAMLTQHPVGFPQMLIALHFAQGPTREIVIAGDRDGSHFNEVLTFIRKGFHPLDVVLHHPSGGEGKKIEALASFMKDQKPLQEKTTVYVCRSHVCDLPVATLGDIEKKLAS